MTLVSKKDQLLKAKEGDFAIGQYSINNLESAQDFFAGR
jgi:6-phospho-5-dehydro-2-deoxy-D-gluconate aldolase